MIRLSSLALCFVLVSQVYADISFSAVCAGIGKDAANCKASFDIPTGVSVRECRNKFFKLDDCKTKSCFNYPCGGIKLRTCKKCVVCSHLSVTRYAERIGSAFRALMKPGSTLLVL